MNFPNQRHEERSPLLIDLTRLLGAVADAGASLDERRAGLLDGLADWLGAISWEFWTGAGCFRSKREPEAVTASAIWSNFGACWYASCGPAMDFPPSKLELARLTLDLSPWLADGSSWEEEDEPRLSPRQSQVLELLLRGAGRKEIAERLAVSPNTVAGYARDLYRLFGVSSQPALQRLMASTRLM